MHWVKKASPDEVSGLGKVVIDDDGLFTISKAILLPQENSGGSTDIEAEDMSRAMFKMKDDPGSLNFWWHSHGNMGVFWSATDDATIDALAKNGWFISTVFNAKSESLTCFYQGSKSGSVELCLDNLRLNLVAHFPTELTGAWDSEYEKNVKKKTVFQGNQFGQWEGNVWVPNNILNRKISKKNLKAGRYFLNGKTFYITDDEIKRDRILAPDELKKGGTPYIHYNRDGFIALIKRENRKNKRKNFKDNVRDFVRGDINDLENSDFTERWSYTIKLTQEEQQELLDRGFSLIEIGCLTDAEIVGLDILSDERLKEVKEM
jgi:hypothetical protein